MRTFRRFLATTLLTSTVAACGGGGSEGPGDDLPEDDTTAPAVVSMTPEDGAVGQRADAVVTITFSEAMDQASVEGTLDTSDLGEVELSWNAAGDVLTITPVEALPYAEGDGNDPATIDPFLFTVTLGNAGVDLAGNGMDIGAQVTFATLKSVSTVFELDQAMTRSITADEDLLHNGDDPLVIGDLDSDEAARALFTFDIAELPAGAVEIASATFATRQMPNEVSGYPYGDGGEDEGLGEAVLIDHVSYGALDNAAFNSHEIAHAHLGSFCIEDQVIVEHDVTAAVESDRANRESRGDVSQYLLRFPIHNDEDGDQDRTVISRDLSELQVTYLAE